MYQNYVMLASYNSDTKEIEWLKNFRKDIPEVTKDVKDFFEIVGSEGYEIANDDSFIIWAEQFDLADKHFQKWLETVKSSGIVYKTSEEALHDYQFYLKSTGESSQFASLKTKALSASMKVLSTIGWMAIFTATTMALKGIVNGIDNIIHSSERCRERVDNLMSSFQKSLGAANDHASAIDKLSDEYARLAKGVDTYGRSINLTSDEFDRYHELTNQIAGMFPDMVQGWDAEGNAILKVKDNVDELRKAYEEERISAYNSLITNEDSKDILKNAENVILGKSGSINQNNILSQLSEALGSRSYDDAAKLIYGRTDIMDYGKTKYNPDDDNTWVFNKLGINSPGKLFDYDTHELAASSEQIYEIQKKIQAVIKENNAAAAEALSPLKEQLKAYLFTDENYGKLSTEAKTTASMLIANIDESFVQSDKEPGTFISGLINSLIEAAPQVQQALSGLLNLDLSKMSLKEAREIVDKYVGYLVEAFDTTPAVIKAAFNLTSLDETANELRNRVYDVWGKGFENPRAKSALTDQLNSFFDENGIDTEQEIQNFLDLTAGVETLTEAIATYNQETEKSESPSSLTFTEDQVKAIDDYKSYLKTLQTALEDLDNTDVTDLITKFNDYDWSAYQSGAKTLEDVINELAARALNNLSSSLGNTADMFKYLYDEIFDAEAKLSSLEAELTKNTDEFNSLQEAIGKVKAGQSFSADEISSLINTYSGLADKIIITADGYSIEESALSSLADSNKAANNKIIAAEIKSTETVIEQTKAKINALKITLDAYNQVANAWNGGYGDNEAAEGNKQLLEAENKLSELLERLNNLQGRFLESEASSASGSAKSASEFAESVDWLSQSIEALEANVDGLNDAFANAKGYDEQIKSIDNLIAGQKELQSAYDTTSKTYDSLYKDKLDKLKALGLSDKEVQQVHNRINGLSADKLRELYDSGNISSLFEDFKGKGDNSTAEKLYNEIQDAIKYVQLELDSQQNFLKIGVELDKKALQKLELSRDNNQAKADVINARLDDNELTDRLKLKLLGQLQKQTEALYNDEIAIAKANKDTNEQKKLEIERAKELRDIESQRNEILNGSVDAMIARHERKIRDIQNVIDETGRAAFEQYQAMIAEGDAQIRLNEQKVAQAQSEIQLLESRGINSGEAYNDAVENLGKCKDELSECIQKTKGWHTAILNLNIENIDKVLDSFDDKLDSINKNLNDVNKSMSDYQDYISAAQYVVQQQIDAQNELKESLQNQLDALQDSNEARQQALNLQKALWELEKAKNQKTVKVYREGQGYVYEADQNAVRTAQENYDNALYNNKVYQIQTQIKGIDDYIAGLSKIQGAWGDITREIEDAANLAKAMSKFGNNFASKVVSGDTSFMQGVVDVVTALNQQKNSLEQSKETIEALDNAFNDMKDDMQSWIRAYEESGVSFEEATLKIKSIVEGVYPGIAQSVRQEGFDIGEYIQGILNTFDDDVSEGINFGISSAMSGAVNGAIIGSGIYDDIEAAKNNVRESGIIIGDNLNKILKDTAEIYDAITQIIKDEVNEQTSAISYSTDSISDYFTSMADQTTEALDVLVSNMQRVAKETSELAAQIRNSTAFSGVSELSSPVIGGLLAAQNEPKPIKPSVYHEGIRDGFVGEALISKEKEQVRFLGTKELKPFEVPGILRNGEAVFNEEQQAMLLRNCQSAMGRSIIIPRLPDYNNLARGPQSPGVNVEFAANSIVLNEVNSGEEILKEITAKIKPVFMQTFSSINR